MTTRSNPVIRFFDKYSLVVPSALNCVQDGSLGKRMLLITDAKEQFRISFEEGMPMMDMLPQTQSGVSFQCCRIGKYIHLRRSADDSVAYFHMEFEDMDGAVMFLPGQMVASPEYKWADGVEPVLLELLENISIIEEVLTC